MGENNLMGRIRDFLAKWQSIEKPEWEKIELESKNKVKYKEQITDDEKEWVIRKEQVEEEDTGNMLSVVYDELDNDMYAVYAVFTDSESQNKVHYEEFEHRKDGKDRLEELLDEYSEIDHRLDQ